MRLRPLSEAECYARCYGRGHAGDRNPFVRVLASRDRRESPGEDIRRHFEQRLDAHGPEAEAEAA